MTRAVFVHSIRKGLEDIVGKYETSPPRVLAQKLLELAHAHGLLLPGEQLSQEEMQTIRTLLVILQKNQTSGHDLFQVIYGLDLLYGKYFENCVKMGRSS